MTVPMKCRRVNSITNPPWTTEEIRRAINLKKTNYNSMRETALETLYYAHTQNVQLPTDEPGTAVLWSTGQAVGTPDKKGWLVQS